MRTAAIVVRPELRALLRGALSGRRPFPSDAVLSAAGEAMRRAIEDSMAQYRVDDTGELRKALRSTVK